MSTLCGRAPRQVRPVRDGVRRGCPLWHRTATLLVANLPEVDGDLVRDVTEILTSLRVRLHRRRSAARTATQGVTTITGSAVP